MLYSDYEALKYLSTRHVKWVEFLQNFQFFLKQKYGQLNKIVDALSKRHALLNAIQSVVVGFEIVKILYENDYDFGNLWKACLSRSKTQFFIHDDYLFKGKQLCIPNRSLREAIILEAHGGGLAGHLGRDKTLILVQENLYLPKLVQHVEKIVNRCVTCHKVKMLGNNVGLYTSFPIPIAPWEDVSMNFIVGLPRTQRGKDSILMVVDGFSKMAHFGACNKTSNATHAGDLYFKDIVKLHVIPKSITYDRDSNFLSHFWRILWKKLGTMLQFSSSHHPANEWTN